LFLECTKTLDLSTGFSQNINMWKSTLFEM
jgi:hypothetical protein